MHAPLLIVGGGPAGSAAAITLARAGKAPLVIERSAAASPVVCGGFLGWDALAALRRLGIDVDALGARPIRLVRLFAGNRSAEAELPYEAAGLSRKTLDAALLASAAAAGATVLRGLSVRAVDAEQRSVRLDNGRMLTCDSLFLATGKHELRGMPRDLSDYRAELAAGIRMELRATPDRERALAGIVELHLFQHGYAGLLLQEDGTANLCLSVSQRRLRVAGGAAALLAEIIDEAPALAARVGPDLPVAFAAIAGVPYGWRAQPERDGLFRIGDQGAVIASLVGDGIAIALTSGQAAASAMLAQGASAAPDWQRGFAAQAHRPIAVAEALRHGASHPFAANMAVRALALIPGLSRVAARMTRIESGHGAVNTCAARR
jgi:menaquinone-9 beta-reductase